MDGMTAARIGTREIALAVLATSLSLIVIFVPDRVHGRHRRPVLHQLRADRRLRRRDEPVRLVHAHAHALQPVPEARAQHAATGMHRQVEVGLLSGGSSTAATAGSCSCSLRFKFLIIMLTMLVISRARCRSPA